MLKTDLRYKVQINEVVLDGKTTLNMNLFEYGDMANDARHVMGESCEMIEYRADAGADGHVNLIITLTLS